MIMKSWGNHPTHQYQSLTMVEFFYFVQCQNIVDAIFTKS